MPLWKSIERFNQDPETIVVVPSMSIDAINSGAVMQAYEERFLFLLLLLRQPRARLIYVTSQRFCQASSITTSVFCPVLFQVMHGNAFSLSRLLTARCVH